MIALDNQLVAAFDIYGNVIDYEVPISELDRKDKGRLNNDIASTLSQTISHIHSKENAVKNNGSFCKNASSRKRQQCFWKTGDMYF